LTLNLLCEHSGVFLATWPISGMTRNGAAFTRPTWERRTSALVLSFGHGAAILPTPDASFFDGDPTTAMQRRERERSRPESKAGNGFGLTLAMTATTLPTPQAYEADHGGSQHPDKRAGHQIYLSDVIEHTMNLPTPGHGDGKRGAADPRGRKRHKDDGRREHQTTLSDVAAAGLMPTPRASDGAKGGPNARGSSGDLMMPAVAAQLPTPAARDWKSGASNLLGTNARPLNEIVETGLPRLPTPTTNRARVNSAGLLLMPGFALAVTPPSLFATPLTSNANGPGRHGTRGGRPDLNTTATLLPTPTASDGKAGNETRSGARSGELLLAGVTRAMLQRGSSGAWVTTTSRRRSKRGKSSRSDPHPSQQCLIDEATGGSTPGSVSG
jgi:hypothetical protein